MYITKKNYIYIILKVNAVPFSNEIEFGLGNLPELRGTTQQNHTNVADCKATPSEPQRTRACTDIACFFPMILI
jgi:hypothetical protein